MNLTRHIIIVGWNAFGLELARSLIGNGVVGPGSHSHLVLCNDLSQDERDAIAVQLNLESRLHFVYGSVTHEGVLRKTNPDKARVIYLLPKDAGLASKDADQETLYAALAIRELAPRVSMYGEVVLPENRTHLLRAGVNEVVVRGEVASRLLGMMGANLSMWNLMESLMGVRGASLLGYRLLSSEEKEGTWGELLVRARKASELPLGVCRVSSSVSLEDVLDSGSALDSFILELFRNSGQKTTLGATGPEVLTNPPDALALVDYDAILYLKSGRS